MDTKKIVDRKLSFMRMKPKMAKPKPAASSGPPAAPAKSVAMKMEAVEESIVQEIHIPAKPSHDELAEQDVKPNQGTRSDGGPRELEGVTGLPQNPPSVGGDTCEPSTQDLKPVLESTTPRTEEAILLPSDPPPARSSDGPVPSSDERNNPTPVTSSAAKEPAIRKKPRPKSAKPTVKPTSDGIPLVDVDENVDEDDEPLEVSEDNHPVDNIMILKQLSNGRMRKKVVKSKLHDWKREAQTKFATDDSEKSVTMRDLIFFRSSKDKKKDEAEENGDDQRDEILDDDPFASAALEDPTEELGASRSVVKRERQLAATADDLKPSLNSVDEDEEENEEMKSAAPETDDGADCDASAPKVKIGADGSIILDEESLVVRSTASLEADRMKSGPLIHDDSDSFLFVSEDRRKLRKEIVKAKEWTITDLAVFYKALSIVGTDFSMMEVLFKNRTRKELKLKFGAESRRNPQLIEKALTGKAVQFDLTLLPEFKEDPKEKAPKEKKKRGPKKSVAKSTPAVGRKRRARITDHDSEEDADEEFDVEKTLVRDPPHPSWNTIESIPETVKQRKPRAKRRKTAGKGKADPSEGPTSGPVTVSERVVGIDAPRVVVASSHVRQAPETPIVEEAGRTFAELRSPAPAVLAPPASPAMLRVRTHSTSSSGVGSPVVPTGGQKIVIVATRTDCPSCPKYHLYANDKQNFTEAELQDAISEAMRRVQALRARNAALPASAHAPNCPMVPAPEKAPSAASYRSKAYENTQGLFQTFAPAAPKVVAVRRIPAVQNQPVLPNPGTVSEGTVTRVETTFIPPTQLA